MKFEYNWTKLYRIGAIAAFIIVLIIPIQLAIFALLPPPSTIEEFIDLFHKNWIIGLLSLDFLYYINNILLAFVYLGLFASLRKTNFANMLVATLTGLVGIATYYASTVGFEMMSLSGQYHLAESPEVQQQLLSAGQGLMIRYKGTAFNIYYVLNAIALIIISKVMFKSRFSKPTAIWGLVSGLLMIIPSTAGTIGLIFSMASLVPWIIFSLLVGKGLYQLAQFDEKSEI